MKETLTLTSGLALSFLHSQPDLLMERALLPLHWLSDINTKKLSAIDFDKI